MFAWILTVMTLLLNSSTTTVPGGEIEQIVCQSEFLQTNRVVRIFLPEDYHRHPKKRFPVLYVHDGQNVFSTAGPNISFGWGNWGLDTTVQKLIEIKRMQPVIVVAVDHGRNRYWEYRGHSKNPDDRQRRFQNFLIQELKPAIDRAYRTLTGPANTAVMGSSLGGLSSIGLAWEHPDVFGKAAGLSGAFQIENKEFLQILTETKTRRPRPRLYLDSGFKDYGGGDDGKANTLMVVDELRRLGWKEGKDLHYFCLNDQPSEVELLNLRLPAQKIKESATNHHNEFFWRIRVWRALIFLFPAKGT